MNDYLHKLTKNKVKYIKSCGAIMFSTSTFLTFNGFSIVADANGSGAMGYFIALMMAIGSGAFFYLFWQTAIGTVMNQRGTIKRSFLITIIVLGLPFIVSISSWSNVTAIAGNSAMDMHQDTTLMLAESNLTQHYKHSTAIQNIIPEIEGEIAAYTKLAEEELKTGKISGRKGPGAVQDALGNTAERLKKLLATINGHINTSKKKIVKAQHLLDKARKEAAKDTPLVQRQNAINNIIDKLNILFSDMNASGLAGSVIRTLEALPASSRSLTYLSLNPAVAKRQQHALNAIESSLDITTQTLSHVAAQISALPDTPEINHKRITPMDAVLIYARSFIPAWIGGVTLDIGMLFPLLMILAAISGLSDEDKARLRVEGISIGEAIDVEVGKERIQRARQREIDLMRDNNAYLGREDNNGGRS